VKAFTASGLSIAIALALAAATGLATAATQERSEASAGPSSGLERPLLSLALKNRIELGLSAEQEKSLQDLVERFGKQADRSRGELRNAERELAALLKQEPGDLAQVESKVRAMEKLRADLRIARIRTVADGLALLTPEQRTKLDALATSRGVSGQGRGARGAEEMHRFMSSERMPQAMSAMMAMAERMGGGDTMLGMVRMMEMMSMMGNMMGSEGMMGGGGMMENTPAPRSQPRGEERK
jgi:Spy/CpxP family protein refolding chaperone